MTWLEFRWNTIAGIVANIAFALIPSVIFIRSYFARRCLRKFLGLNSSSNILRIYFLRVFIPSGTSLDPQGSQRSYSGLSIPEKEFGAIQTFLLTGFFDFLAKDVFNKYAKNF